MERENHAAAAGYRRWESSPEDVIVLSSGRQPRQQNRQQAAAVVGQGQHPEPPEKVYYKTKLCDKYEASGRCVYEDGCTFAHGSAELRPPLPTLGGGGWRRPAEHEHEHEHGHARGSGGLHGGGRVCFEFRDKGTCHFGGKCAFAHASAPEMRYPGGVEARRSATPPARVIFPAAAAPRVNSYAAAAPALARAFPPVHAAAVRDRLLLQQHQEQDDGKAGALTRLSRRKTSGIYGDWPEQY